MCGIFGYSFRNNAIDPQRRVILGNNLARLNDKRGGDSWGIAVIKGNNINTIRGLGDMQNHAYHFIDAPTLFAHTRLATRGAKTTENAHPFEIGNIIGAHNGMISNHYELEKKYEDRKDFEVDSMHLFAHLNEDRPFDELEGYGAIEWVKKDDPSRIYLSRLRNGSLNIWGIGNREADKTEGIVWSSDEKHLLEALYCVGIKDFFPYNVEEGATYLVKNGEAFIASARKLTLKDPASVRRYSGGSHSDHWLGGHSGGYPGGYNRWGAATGGAGKDQGSFPDKGAAATDGGLEDWTEWQNYCKSKTATDKPELTAEA